MPKAANKKTIGRPSVTKDKRTTKKKKPAPLFIAMILDKSGSMSPLSKATVDGFNEYLETQRKQAADARMTVTLFDDRYLPIHLDKPVSEIPDLTVAAYKGDGMYDTALNDAIGRTVTSMENSPSIAGRRVLVVVMTDGMENASKEWRPEAIAALRARKEADGWKFVFFGQSAASMDEGRRIGVSAMRSARYAATGAGTVGAYRSLSNATSLYAMGVSEKVWAGALHDQDEARGTILGIPAATGIGDARLLKQTASKHHSMQRESSYVDSKKNHGSCTCFKPLMVVIPPGGHVLIHCPVHGEKKVWNGVEVILK